MSLTSTELNYLVWRYLQESGYDLAAYAFAKDSDCQLLAQDESKAVLTKIEPGCLVNLVQKGILYATTEMEVDDSDVKSEAVSLLGALMKDELKRQKSTYDIANGDQEHRTERMQKLQHSRSDETGRDETQRDVKSENGLSSRSVEFTTSKLKPITEFSESLSSSWHPYIDVFAYGREDSTAVINAVKDNEIVESVTLEHPNILNIKNDIILVSWSPDGSTVLTVGYNGEFRAWSSDGRLKNIANNYTTSDIARTDESVVTLNSGVVTDLIWNNTGNYFISLDSTNNACLWNGTNLNLIQKLQITSTNIHDSGFTFNVCWLDDLKFAITTPSNTIKIYAITDPSLGLGAVNVQLIGSLNGHKNMIISLLFDASSRLLASASDVDYSIKLWSSSSSQEVVNLNVQQEDNVLRCHSSPIVGLHWLNKIKEDSFLLCVSMEGTTNIWNVSSGKCVISTNLIKNQHNYRLANDQNAHLPDSLIFITSVSHNKNYMVIGDYLGHVSIWDLREKSYENFKGDSLNCLGFYHPRKETDNGNDKYGGIGVCSATWNATSTKLSVAYAGTSSMIIDCSMFQ